MSIFRLPIKIIEREEEKMIENWSRKKLFVLYLVSMPFIAMFFVYYAMNVDTSIGTISLLTGGIILFAVVYIYLRAVLEERKRRH